jgi:hypothetical protein
MSEPMRSDVCIDGVTLPPRGPCPICGATENERCFGRAYAEMMRMTAKDDSWGASDEFERGMRQTDRRTVKP